jgi:hypothetical protein
MSEQLHTFECKTCGYDSEEAGGELVVAGEHHCPICLDDTRHYRPMTLTAVTPAGMKSGTGETP